MSARPSDVRAAVLAAMLVVGCGSAAPPANAPSDGASACSAARKLVAAARAHRAQGHVLWAARTVARASSLCADMEPALRIERAELLAEGGWFVEARLLADEIAQGAPSSDAARAKALHARVGVLERTREEDLAKRAVEAKTPRDQRALFARWARRVGMPREPLLLGARVRRIGATADGRWLALDLGHGEPLVIQIDEPTVVPRAAAPSIALDTGLPDRAKVPRIVARDPSGARAVVATGGRDLAFCDPVTLARGSEIDFEDPNVTIDQLVLTNARILALVHRQDESSIVVLDSAGKKIAKLLARKPDPKLGSPRGAVLVETEEGARQIVGTKESACARALGDPRVCEEFWVDPFALAWAMGRIGGDEPVWESAHRRAE